MADGSTRFIKNTISSGYNQNGVKIGTGNGVFQAITTRAQGEVVSADSF
jgi:hypothetical protein